MTAIRKSETCEDQLRRMCRSIAMDITAGKEDASKWMEDVYDIRYLVGSDKKYMGAQLMVAGGGPNIWVNTWTNEVEGYWADDKCTWAFQDNIGLDDYCQEMYGE